MTPQNNKETIYIDAEDEITAIIEKVRGSGAKIVALVLPKRSTTLQSIVNLKLLKRTADNAKKNLVLITSEHSIVPLAGAVGLHVAKTPQSKPAIPPAPTLASEEPMTVVDETDDVMPDPMTPVGILAAPAAAEETIELDNDKSAAAAPVPAASKKAKNKKLKVPDFDRFRLLLFGGIALLILLIVGGIFAFAVLPKAKIVINTDTTSVQTDLSITAKTDITTVDADKNIIPAVAEQVKKTDTEKVPATGQRNDGTKATGTMTLTNCINDGQPHTVLSGTVFSAGSVSFTLDQTTTLDPSLFSGPNCKSANFGLSKTVPVTAAQAGDQYNVSSQTYSSPTDGISAKGSQMTGGTTKMTQVVSQSDIDAAKQKALDALTGQAKNDLKAQFTNDNATPIADTFGNDAPVITSSANVNDPASEVTVTATISYNQMGVKSADLKQLVETDAKKHIDASKQAIQDNGLNQAVMHVTSKTASTVKFDLQTLVVAGPQLDANGIKKDIAGKKKGDTISLIQARPGITNVKVTYSPFWVSSTPKNIKHISITFDQPNDNNK